MRRIIREEEPPKPSTRLEHARRHAHDGLGQPQGRPPATWTGSVRGELDWIVMKALEKDRRRRYETANDFAADVMRYLTDKPVEACPPSTWYRFGKFAHRNRAALMTASLFATALIAGTAVSVWQALRAKKAEADSGRHAEETQLVVDYMIYDVFGSAAPEKAHGRTVTVHDLITATQANIPSRFGQRPLVEAAFREALGRSYEALGRYREAQREFRHSAGLRAAHLGLEHPDTLAVQALLVKALSPRTRGSAPSKWRPNRSRGVCWRPGTACSALSTPRHWLR